MATIKSFTDISQSKKLAEILPLESADMYYLAKPDDTNSNMVVSDICIPRRSENDGQAFGEACAWSLAALLDTFPKGEYKDVDLCFGGYQGDKYIPEWCCSYEQQEPFIIEACYADNPVDACVAMIEKLNELNLL